MKLTKDDFECDHSCSCGFNLIISLQNEESDKSEELRDQILKNQEAAEKLERVDSLFAELEIPPPYDLWLAESIQIREHLKKYQREMAELHGEYDYGTGAVANDIQKILEGKK